MRSLKWFHVVREIVVRRIYRIELVRDHGFSQQHLTGSPLLPFSCPFKTDRTYARLPPMASPHSKQDWTTCSCQLSTPVVKRHTACPHYEKSAMTTYIQRREEHTSSTANECPFGHCEWHQQQPRLRHHGLTR
jgi:hypothetical protein